MVDKTIQSKASQILNIFCSGLDSNACRRKFGWKWGRSRQWKRCLILPLREIRGWVVNAVREVVAPGSGKFPARPTSFYSSTKPAHFFSPITSTNFYFLTIALTKKSALFWFKQALFDKTCLLLLSNEYSNQNTHQANSSSQKFKNIYI